MTPPKPWLPEDGNSASEHPSSNDDGAGKRVVPQQGELALERSARAKPVQDEAPALPAPGSVADRDMRTGSGVPDVAEGPTGAVQPDIAKAREGSPAMPKGSVLKAGAADGQEPAKTDGVRSDAPRPLGQRGQPSQERQRPPNPAAEARKLMLEDGLAEPDPSARDDRGFGDVDMDI